MGNLSLQNPTPHLSTWTRLIHPFPSHPSLLSMGTWVLAFCHQSFFPNISSLSFGSCSNSYIDLYFQFLSCFSHHHHVVKMRHGLRWQLGTEGVRKESYRDGLYDTKARSEMKCLSGSTACGVVEGEKRDVTSICLHLHRHPSILSPPLYTGPRQ